MAVLAQSLKFDGFKVLLGNGATPEVFAMPCGFTSRSLKLDKAMTETLVPYCDDEDKASWIERDVNSKSGTIDGEGVLAHQSLPTWIAYWDSDVSKNCRVEFWRAGNLIGHFAGAFHLASFEMTGERKGRITSNVSMQSDGEITWTVA